MASEVDQQAHWVAHEFSGSASIGLEPMDRLEIVSILLATLERLEAGATLDDLRELLKADLVEAALVKEPVIAEVMQHPLEIREVSLVKEGGYPLMIGPLNTPQIAETLEDAKDFFAAFGGKAGQ